MDRYEFESAAEAAQRFGVTLRAVQKWAAAGRIPGAKKVGRTWFIPRNAIVLENTIDTSSSRSPAKIYKISDFRPSMPLLNSSFEPGKCLEFIESIPDEDDRNIAMGEYLFYTGRAEAAVELLSTYVDSEDISLRYSASVITIFASISHGNTQKAEHAQEIVSSLVRASFGSNASEELNAVGIMTLIGGSVLWHAPVPEHLPALKDYIKYLPEGYRLWCCYLIAHQAYLEKDYVKALTVADMALAFCRKTYPLAEIYIHIISVIALMNLHRPEEAKKRFERAWELTHKDGFIEPVAEHHGMMLGIIEVYYKRSHPEDYKKLMAISGVFGKYWRKIHNIRTASEVTDILTPTEFTVAMLYNRGWSAQETASFLEVSESTVRNYIKTIYIKLGITNKKELMRFMIK